MPGSNSKTRGRFCDELGSNIVVQYSVGSVITLHGRITAREHVDRLGTQVHPMIQTLFANNDAVFREHNAHIHRVGTVQSWFEEHKGELSIFPGQHNHQISTSLNHSSQFRRHPTSRKQVEDVLQE
jgi:hypothetical protein